MEESSGNNLSQAKVCQTNRNPNHQIRVGKKTWKQHPQANLWQKIAFQLRGIFIAMIHYTKDEAIQKAQQYQWLVGREFLEPYSACKITWVIPELQVDGTYDVMLVLDAFGAGSIPEFFGFQNPKVPLLKYLEAKGIPYF
jgi:hypothetical protein